MKKKKRNSSIFLGARTSYDDVFHNRQIEAADALIDRIKSELKSELGQHYDPATTQLRMDAAKDAQRLIGKFIAEHEQDAPPHRAGYLLDLITSGGSLRGDLDEQYWLYYLPEYGRRRARIWYWVVTVWSVSSLAVG